MLAVLAVPRRLEAAARVQKRVVRLRRARTSVVKRLRQTGNLCRTAALQAGVDLPRVAAGVGDQQRDAYVAEVHRTASNFTVLRSSISVNAVAAVRALSPTSLRVCWWARSFVVWWVWAWLTA